MRLRPDQLPGAIFAGKFTTNVIRPIVVCQTCLQIICVADVKPASRILKNVNPKHEGIIGSRGRTRTYNHTVNSRVLYH